jgi:hypothetical protein
MPTRDNAAEGNLYVRMDGGYLRILYPEPEVCLHLPAWKEFYGFDLQGQEGWFDIELNPDTCELAFRKAQDRPRGLERDIQRRNSLYRPESVLEVEQDENSKTDYYGSERNPGKCVPGPFQEIREQRTYRIDPRKTGFQRVDGAGNPQIQK